MQILKEPKNALVKQYQKLFEMEHVKLKFTDGSLVAIAKEALKRKTGARGLRSILENAMLDIMYEIPSQTMVKEVVINDDVIYSQGKTDHRLRKRGGVRLTGKHMKKSVR